MGWGRFPVSVKLFIQLPRSKSLSTVPKIPKRITAFSLVPFLIAGTVTAGSVQDGLLQDLYFERKMAEFSEPWEINNAYGTKYDEISTNNTHVVLIRLASKERNSIPGFSLISGFY